MANALVSAAFSIFFAMGCVGSEPDRPINAPPPPAPLPEIVSDAPAPGMVRVPGAWHWNGVQYIWIPGRWESPPPAPGGK